MILLKESDTIRKLISSFKRNGASIGFVPTMGALHEGHLSLIKKSKQDADITVCSLFVNPTQFNDPGDFKNYPSTMSKDIVLLEAARCDIVFTPSIMEMYPNGYQGFEKYKLGEIEEVLEGKFRPGHFQGVCQIVDKLLAIVEPKFLFMGQKDLQQCLVVRELINLKNIPTNLSIVETARDPSGLAMSSRNLRLSESEKFQALNIYKMLNYAKLNFKTQTLSEICFYAKNFLLHHGFVKVDYFEIADMQTLNTVTKYNGDQKLVALVAAYIGSVRLIDNVFLNP